MKVKEIQHKRKHRLPKIARRINSRRLRWAGHIAGVEGGRSALKILSGTPT
jgi:hypothetical protein